MLKGILPGMVSHMKDETIKIERFSHCFYDECNIMRFEPLGQAKQYRKGDYKLVVDMTLRYTVDV